MSDSDQKTILFTFRDGGGANNALPVIPKLIEMNCKVVIYVEPETRSVKNTYDYLEKNNLTETVPVFEFPDLESAVKAMNELKPDALVSSMDSPGWNRDILIDAHKKGIKTHAVQDGWGNRLEKEEDWNPAKDHIDRIYVNDKIGKELIERAWPNFPSENIIESGFPVIDQYFDLDSEILKKSKDKVLKALGSGDDQKIIFYAGQLDGSSYTLENIIEGIKDDPKIKLIVRQHPRMEKEAPEEFANWNVIVNENNILDTSKIDNINFEDSLFAADYVVSMFSTTTTQAIALGKRAFHFMGNDASKSYNDEFPNLQLMLPLAKLGCVEVIDSPDSLKHSLNNIDYICDSNSLNATLKIDGNSAKRLADSIIESLD